MAKRRREQVVLGCAALAALGALPAAVRQPGSGLIYVSLLVTLAVSQFTPARRTVPQTVGPLAAIVWLQLLWFPMPGGVLLLGIVLGLLAGMVALGMALIYRANQILNFAQADLGALPTVLVVCLIAFSGLNYFLALGIGLVAAVVIGALVEFLVIRRFFSSPRLILTVATIGLSQLFTVFGGLLPHLWGQTLISEKIGIPWHVTFTVAPLVFTGDHLLALVVVPLVLLGLAAFLRYTDVGTAIRASADRGDLARGLGVPVKRLQTVVWCLATLLSFLGVFLRAGIVGLPAVATISIGALLTSLAALMLGRLTDLPGILLSAVGLGMLEQAVLWKYPQSPGLVYPVFAAVILVALLVRRGAEGRRDWDSAGSWEASAEVRATPIELRGLPEVRAARAVGLVVGLGVLVALPSVLSPSEQVKAASVAIFVMVALSIVVLTGWAGQVSLGQMSFVAVGAVVGAIATNQWGYDLSLAMLLAGAAGAVVAVVVGLPALRLRGLFLAVTTLAFAVASTEYLLDRASFSWLPQSSISRPMLFGHFDLVSQRSMYEVAVGSAVVALLAVRGLRRSRTGRALMALRDNERGVQAIGIGVTRAKLTGFAISGFLAATAGCLNVELFGAYTEASYGPAQSFAVFTATVVGGLGSLAGAVIGALFLSGGQWFLTGDWQLLPSALGVLVVLLILPGGLGDLVYRVRDILLRRVARRRDLIVPSLLADSAVPPTPLAVAPLAASGVDPVAEPVLAGAEP